MSRFGGAHRRPRQTVAEAEAAEVSEGKGPQGLSDLADFNGPDDGRPQPECHVEVAHYTARNWGGRHENEDRWMAESAIYSPRRLPFHMIGVMDGHDTESASDTVARMLPGVLARHLNEGKAVGEAYTLAMEELEDALKKVHATAGTCVVSCTIAGRFVWCANLGDCRAVLVPLVVNKTEKLAPKVLSVCWLSRDHKASAPEERKRIMQAGGMVTDGRVEGLEPSRTLGDFDVKMHVKKGVISIVPEVRRYELGDGSGPAHAILVCATDGVWDVMTGQDVCDLVQARKELGRLQAGIGGGPGGPAPDCQPLRDLAEDLVQFSIAKGSRDDCTAVVALLSVGGP